jgi:hypothetical protein
MMKNLLFLSSTLLFSTVSLAQNVGINGSGTAPAASAMLDIVATDKGLLVPRVALTSLTAAGPVTSPATSLLVYNTATAGASPNNVIPGFYYWDGTKWVSFGGSGGKDWSLLGNAGTTVGTNFIGSTDNVSFCIKTNNTERGRFLSTGEIVFGATTTTIPDDFFSAVSNATLDWAVNGYSSFDGSGIYGQVATGSTIYGGVQGEYYGTNSQGCGVRGLVGSTAAGTGFGAVVSGVNGNGALAASSAGTYKFGVYGSGGYTSRGGGVMGYDFGAGIGALGYYAANGNDYCVYGFSQGHTTGLATGKMIAGAGANIPFNEPSTSVGLGIYGGVMGGWIKGLVYGTNFSGQKYGVYVHGNTVTNSKYVQLNSTESSDVRIASYATTALTNELTSKGKVTLVNGKANVTFDSKLIELCDIESLVITATSMGNCNGVYIDEITKSGFKIKELNNGTHNVAVSFIISGTLKQASAFTETEILSKQYESNMDGVMHNDNDAETDGTPIWYDGQNVRHDPVDEELTGRRALKEAQARDNEKLARPKQ